MNDEVKEYWGKHWGVAYEQRTVCATGSILEVAQAQKVQENKKTVLFVTRMTRDFQTEEHPVHNGKEFPSYSAAVAYAERHGLSGTQTLTAEEIERKTAEITGESEATRAVVRALLTDQSMGHEYWESMIYSSFEAFTQSAKKKLGDATEIDGDHLRDADWSSIYEEFKGMK